MKIIKGNLLDLADAGEFDVIIHGCNCHNTMGSGIAKQIKDRYPAAYEADCRTIANDKSKLGKCSSVKINNKFTIINAYTQYNFSPRDVDHFEYDSFKQILDTLTNAFPENTRFGLPLIGCGLAGGNKEQILSIIKEFSKNRNVTIVEFE